MSYWMLQIHQATRLTSLGLLATLVLSGCSSNTDPGAGPSSNTAAPNETSETTSADDAPTAADQASAGNALDSAATDAADVSLEEATADDLAKIIEQQAGKVVLVDYWATW